MIAHTTVDPQALVGALLARYRGLRTYRDRGVLRVRPAAANAPPIEMPFDSAFAAPGRFRFEFHYPHPLPKHPGTRYVVGCDGARAFLYTRFPEARPELRDFPTLARAVGAASAISCGAVQTIARLLFADVHGTCLADLTGTSHAGVETVDGVRCHRIAGTHRHAGDMELAVGADDGLLRRVARTAAGLAVQELRSSIEVDRPIDPDVFAVESAGVRP